jgi:hypothetical protein
MACSKVGASMITNQIPTSSPSRQAIALLGWVALCFAAASTAVFVSIDGWYVTLNKPSWNPPVMMAKAQRMWLWPAVGMCRRRNARCSFHFTRAFARIENPGDQRGRSITRLESKSEHPHGLSDTDFDEFFTKDKPVIFAFHA